MTSKRERLAQRRKTIGLSQEELAHRLGVERSAVVRWEAGETAPQRWLRPKLAETLGVSLDRLDALLADPDANAGRGHPMPAPMPAANPVRPAEAGTGRDDSKRQERRRLIENLRQQGASTKQIALALCERYGVGRMTAFRWANDLSLAQAADRYNQLRDDPDQKMTGARISEWERWPQPRSRRPPVDALVTLSEVYNCHAGDLIDATDYGHAKQPSGAATPPPAPAESMTASQGQAKAAPSAPIGADRVVPVAERAGERLVEDAELAEAVAAARRQAGRELARLRSEAGLSQQDLANRIGYTRGQVGGAEAGSQATAPEFWQACDRVLAAGGVLVAARARIEAAMKARRDAAAKREEAKREARLQQWRTEHGLVPTRTDDAESLLELEDVDLDLPEGALDLQEISDTTGWPGHVLEQRSIPSHRRHVIKLGGTFTVASLLELLSAEPDRMNEALDSGTVSDNRIQRFERIADELGLQAVKVAPTTLLADAAGNFRSVRRLARQHQPTRFQIRLQRVGAKLGIVVGEILFIEGHFDLAQQWYQAAQHAASEAGDRFLTDIALASEAYLPTYSDDPQGVISLVTPRLEQRPSPTPAIAWLWAFKAKAHAQLGERAKFEQAITEAHAAMAGSTRELVCPGIYSFLPEKLAFYEATGYVRLRDADTAVQATERALELYDLTDTTEPALVRFNKASALAESGEIPEACRVATDALLDRYTYPSVSVMTAARDFDRLLGTDRSTAVRDWRETLITVRRKPVAMALPGPGA